MIHHSTLIPPHWHLSTVPFRNIPLLYQNTQIPVRQETNILPRVSDKNALRSSDGYRAFTVAQETIAQSQCIAGHHICPTTSFPR